jgi:hypothetical protein
MGIIIESIKAAIAVYKKSLHEHKEKTRLIHKDLDYLYLQKLINSLADNQNKIMIVVKLANGTAIEIRRQETAQPQRRDPYQEIIQ